MGPQSGFKATGSESELPVVALRISDSWEVVILVPENARRRARLLAAAIVMCALAGCSGQGPGHLASSPSAPSSANPGGQSAGTWMLTRSALSQMLSDPAVAARLARARIDELLQPGQQPLGGVDATPVVSFSSVAQLRSALAGNALPAGTRAVLYDPEVWAYTPAAEQRDPVLAATQAAQLARSHGLKIIVSPAMDLITVLDPGSSGKPWQTFLDLHIIGSMARVAGTVELQAQSLERDPAAYATFVRQAAAQARVANPNVTVLAGLSTNPPGAAVDSQQLTAAIQASRADVEGYWLNIPGNGPRCRTCNAPQPDLGAAVLGNTL